MLNIVIPMAGHGSRFAKAGYSLPKPLIPVGKTPMIEVVIRNLKPSVPHRFIFICQKSHLETFKDLEQTLMKAGSNTVIVPIDGVTEGAACTVLLAKQYINTDDSLMIANCDQFVDVDVQEYIERQDLEKLDGLIMTMKAYDNKWSYVKLDSQNHVTELKEKVIISDEATVGIYNYKYGNDFVSAAERMISAKDTFNGEYYVAPAYNYMIKDGKKIGIYNIGSLNKGMYGLGVPEDLESFNTSYLKLLEKYDHSRA